MVGRMCCSCNKYFAIDPNVPLLFQQHINTFKCHKDDTVYALFMVQFISGVIMRIRALRWSLMDLMDLQVIGRIFVACALS